MLGIATSIWPKYLLGKLPVKQLPHPLTAPPEIFRPDTWRREESPVYLIGRSFWLLNEEVDISLMPTGLTYAQWAPLLKLYLGQASTMADLSRECQIDAGAMTRMLDRLEAKGLVQRVRSIEDRRFVHIELTKMGCDKAEKIPEMLSKCMNSFLAGFTLDEWNQLKDLLKRLVANGERTRTPG